MLSHLEMVKLVQSRCFSGTLPGYGIIQNPCSTVLDPELSVPSLYGRFKVQSLPYKDNNELSVHHNAVRILHNQH